MSMLREILLLMLLVMARPILAGEFDVVDSFVQQRMKEVGVPGVAVAIVKEGKIVYTKGYGESSPGVPITPQTPFLLASLTKSFTALSVMQLVEEGRIDLDTPITRYLPQLNFADEASGKITVRQLLNHTSGFSTLSGRKHFFSRDVGQEALERSVRDHSAERLTALPGKKFQYSNVNFNMASLIVAKVSGQTFEQYIRERIYAPLQMTSSFTNEADAQTHGLTIGYRFWFGIPIAANDIPYSHTGLGSGGLLSSAEDLARYTLANLGDESGQVLSQTGFAEIHKPGVHIVRDIHYGLGWLVSKKPDGLVIWHRGDMECVHTDIMMAPDEKIGVDTLMNVNSPSKGTQLINIAEGVFGLARGKDPNMVSDDPVPTIVMFTILAIFIIQVVWGCRFILKLRRWQRQPETKPRRWRILIGVIFSVVLNLTIAIAIFMVLPAVFETPYSSIYLFMPDAFVITALSGGFALLWGVARNFLAFRQVTKTALTGKGA